MPVKATRLKIVTRGEARPTRDSGFCERVCIGEEQIRHKIQHSHNHSLLWDFNASGREQMSCLA
jgi:hypothetical protein